MKRPRILRLLLLVIVGAIVAYASYSDRETVSDGASAISVAYESEQSGVMVEAGGIVERELSDDLDGSRHQRFIVRLPNGQTVLLSHNIDLAPRVPLRPNETVRFRGQYEWNDRGGVVHWTHHDPKGRREGGWIDYEGERYR